MDWAMMPSDNIPLVLMTALLLTVTVLAEPPLEPLPPTLTVALTAFS